MDSVSELQKYIDSLNGACEEFRYGISKTKAMLIVCTLLEQVS